MASEGDVLGRADALLRRHATGGAGDAGGIPVLTELLSEPEPPPAEGPAGGLAREVFDRVMAEVEGRLAADLERRLASHLEGQVHAAVASALGDLRQELANAIGDAVSAALRDHPVK